MRKNEKFVMELYLSIIKEGESLYKDIFEDIDAEGNSNAYWEGAFNLYKNLSDEDKDIFSNIIKHVQIDTISHVLGIIDGGVTIENYEDIEPELLLSGESTNEELQDLFLELIEENENIF